MAAGKYSPLVKVSGSGRTYRYNYETGVVEWVAGDQVLRFAGLRLENWETKRSEFLEIFDTEIGDEISALMGWGC